MFVRCNEEAREGRVSIQSASTRIRPAIEVAISRNDDDQRQAVGALREIHGALAALAIVPGGAQAADETKRPTQGVAVTRVAARRTKDAFRSIRDRAFGGDRCPRPGNASIPQIGAIGGAGRPVGVLAQRLSLSSRLTLDQRVASGGDWECFEPVAAPIRGAQRQAGAGTNDVEFA